MRTDVRYGMAKRIGGCFYHLFRRSGRRYPAQYRLVRAFGRRQLHRPTSVTVVVWRPLPISAPGQPRGWPPQRPLPMWTSGNGLLKRSLHKFFVTDVKRVRYKC
jgi:hypothetical protein